MYRLVAGWARSHSAFVCLIVDKVDLALFFAHLARPNQCVCCGLGCGPRFPTARDGHRRAQLLRPRRKGDLMRPPSRRSLRNASAQQALPRSRVSGGSNVGGTRGGTKLKNRALIALPSAVKWSLTASPASTRTSHSVHSSHSGACIPPPPATSKLSCSLRSALVLVSLCRSSHRNLGLSRLQRLHVIMNARSPG